MPPMRSFNVKSATDWIQALFPTLVVLASLAYGMGEMNQRLQNIETKVSGMDEINKALHDQNIEIIVTKKDLSTLDYRITQHFKKSEIEP